MPRIVRLRDDLTIVPDHIACVRLIEPYHAPMMPGHGWIVQATLVFGSSVNLFQAPERSPYREGDPALELADGDEARSFYERTLAEIALDGS